MRVARLRGSWVLPACGCGEPDEISGWEVPLDVSLLAFAGAGPIWLIALLIAQVTTNIAMLLSVPVYFAGSPPIRRAYPALLLVCGLLNVPWWALYARVQWFGAGFYAWLASFFLAAAGMYDGRWRRPRTERQKWETGLISSI